MQEKLICHTSRVLDYDCHYITKIIMKSCVKLNYGFMGGIWHIYVGSYRQIGSGDFGKMARRRGGEAE